mgnify:CR=1 FL=1
MFDVDIVTTWVHHTGKGKDVCAHSNEKHNRYRNLHTFRFAMRSWHRFLPWVRTTWIVTNAAPCWLNASSPRIRIVPHVDIWPEARARDLPTFNSIAIETHLHRIRGLSEHFIYFNDDMLIGKPLPVVNFFDGTGRPVLSKHETVSPIKAAAPQMAVLDHGPYAVTKSLISQVQSKWTAWFQRRSSERCRTGLQPPFWAYQWYMLATSTMAPHLSEPVRFLCCDDERPSQQAAFYRSVFANPPGAIVLNDDFAHPDWISPLHDFMETYYGLDHMPEEDYSKCELYVTQTAKLTRMEMGHIGEGSSPRALGPSIAKAGQMRVVLFNARFGSLRHCEMIRTHQDLRGADVVLLNEVHIGMARTQHRNVANDFASCLHMNYVYGADFSGETLRQIEKTRKLNATLHGNVILSRYPLREAEMLPLPGAGGYWAGGGRNAIIAAIPVSCDRHTEWIDLVSTHHYNARSAQMIRERLRQRARPHIIGGDMRGKKQLKRASGEWLSGSLHMKQLRVTHAPLSDHNFLSATFIRQCHK